MELEIKNQSSIGCADLEIKEKIKILKLEKKSLSLGKLGNFDDNGVLPSTIIKHKNYFYMYYIGWQQDKQLAIH